jgi:VWFA-related protein
MKFCTVRSFLVNLVLFSFAAWAQNPEQELPPAAGNAHETTQIDRSQNTPSKNTAAPESTKSDESLLTLHAAVSEVNLVFTVTDKHGHYIKDLEQKEFEILDDRKPPAEILSFRSETDLPLRVGLLIDISQSVRERFKFEQESAIAFLNQTLRQSDQAFVMGFALTPKVTQDFTNNIGKLAAGIHLLQPGSLTAMYDALNSACDKLLMQPQTSPVRRVVILLSDGYDNASSVTREKVIEKAQRAEVSVYTVSTSLTTRGRGQRTLERIADATGGRWYVPVQITGVAHAFTTIREELRSQYAVSYKPAAFKPDGHYRTIEIRAQNHRGLRIRSRKGYRSVATDYASNQ